MSIEKLAAIEHKRWSRWQAYLHSKCERYADDSLIIPSGLVARWNRQIATEYEHLSESEKESDREQVREYLEEAEKYFRSLGFVRLKPGQVVAEWKRGAWEGKETDGQYLVEAKTE